MASSASMEASTATSKVSGRTGGGNGGEHRQFSVGSLTFTLMDWEVGGGTQSWLAARTKGRFWGALIFLSDILGCRVDSNNTILEGI